MKHSTFQGIETMFGEVILLFAVFVLLLGAVLVWTMFQTNQPETSPFKFDLSDYSTEANRLEALVHVLMRHPLQSHSPLGVLAGTMKTSLSSPRSAVHMAWQLLERELFETVTGHHDVVNDGHRSLEFLRWSEHEEAASGFQVPPGVDSKLIKVMCDIDKMLLINPLLPFTTEQSAKFIQLSAHLINELQKIKYHQSPLLN